MRGIWSGPSLCSCWDVLSTTSGGYSARKQENWWSRFDLRSPHLVVHNLKTGSPYQIVAICGTAHRSGNDSDQLPSITRAIQQTPQPEFKRTRDRRTLGIWGDAWTAPRLDRANELTSPADEQKAPASTATLDQERVALLFAASDAPRHRLAVT